MFVSILGEKWLRELIVLVGINSILRDDPVSIGNHSISMIKHELNHIDTDYWHFDLLHLHYLDLLQPSIVLENWIGFLQTTEQ